LQKKYRHNELSDTNCRKCKKRIKLNVLDRVPRADLCYSCYSKSVGKRANVGKQNRRDNTRRKDMIWG